MHITQIARQAGVDFVSPGGRQIHYRLRESGRDILSCDVAAMDEIRAAHVIATEVHRVCVAAGHAAEVCDGIITADGAVVGYEKEPQNLGGPVVCVRDCRRPDGSESGIGESAILHDSNTYWKAFRTARIEAVAELPCTAARLLEWFESSGLSTIIADMRYRGHAI